MIENVTQWIFCARGADHQGRIVSRDEPRFEFLAAATPEDGSADDPDFFIFCPDV
jgi:hypothetical protein